MSDQRRFLLYDVIEAYLPVDEEQKRVLDGIMVTEKYAGVKAMNQTTFEKGIEKGIERGRYDMLRVMMEERFGPLSVKVLDRIQQLSDSELFDLGKAVVRVSSLKELGFEN